MESSAWAEGLDFVRSVDSVSMEMEEKAESTSACAGRE